MLDTPGSYAEWEEGWAAEARGAAGSQFGEGEVDADLLRGMDLEAV